MPLHIVDLIVAQHYPQFPDSSLLAVSFQPIDTSSQASNEEVEASLEDIPANISPIAPAYSSRSVQSCYNHSTRTAKQWYKHYCQQASLSGDQHPSHGGIRHQTLPIDEDSIIQTTNPHRSPMKLEGSMDTEVNDLLDQAITEASSC